MLLLLPAAPFGTDAVLSTVGVALFACVGVVPCFVNAFGCFVFDNAVAGCEFTVLPRSGVGTDFGNAFGAVCVTGAAAAAATDGVLATVGVRLFACMLLLLPAAPFGTDAVLSTVGVALFACVGVVPCFFNAFGWFVFGGAVPDCKFTVLAGSGLETDFGGPVCVTGAAAAAATLAAAADAGSTNRFVVFGFVNILLSSFV